MNRNLAPRKSLSGVRHQRLSSFNLKRTANRSAPTLLTLTLTLIIALTSCSASPPPTANPNEPTPLPPIPTLSLDDIAAGESLYNQHCASCHGADLHGQPNWKQPLPNGKYPAPPHDNTGHTWHHNDDVLIGVIMNGGDGTGNMTHGDMPAFKDKLTVAQVRQILTYIKSQWGQQQREYQWTRTLERN